MTEPIAPITLNPLGLLVDYGSTGGSVQSAVPCPSSLSFTTTSGIGEFALNGRVSGRRGTMEVYWTPGLQGGIANLATLLLGTAHISLAVSATDKLSVYVTNQAGVDVGVLANAGAPLFQSGRPVKVGLKWDTVAGTVQAYADEVVVADVLWGTFPVVGWPYFRPSTLVVGAPTGGLIKLVGSIQRVTVRDTLV